MVKEINVHNHVLVPKHEALGKEEADELLLRFNISKRQMPLMSSKDSAIKDLNLKRGDIVKITRNSMTASKSIFYRVVYD